MQWPRIITRVTQLIDIIDATTGKPGERKYQQKRMTREGVRDPVMIIRGFLDKYYGSLQHEELPFFRMTPAQIACVALRAKLDFRGNVITRELAALPAGAEHRPEVIALHKELAVRQEQRQAADKVLVAA